MGSSAALHAGGQVEQVGDLPPVERQLFDSQSILDVTDRALFGFDDGGGIVDLDGDIDAADLHGRIDDGVLASLKEQRARVFLEMRDLYGDGIWPYLDGTKVECADFRCLDGLHHAGGRVGESDFGVGDDGTALVGDRTVHDSKTGLGRQRQRDGSQEYQNKEFFQSLGENRLGRDHVSFTSWTARTEGVGWGAF